MRIVGICGSLQAASGNLVLLQTAVAVAPQGVEVTIFDGLRDLPLFNADLEESAPPAVAAWRAALAGADAVLIASPEYGHSLTGVLKNAIDWVIGTSELHLKVVGITTAVNRPDRGRMGLKALAGTLAAVDSKVVGGEPIVRGPEFERNVRDLLQAIVARVTQG